MGAKPRPAMASRGAATTVMVLLVWTVAAMSMLQVTSAAFHRPEGGEDGIYVATLVVDEHGVEQQQVQYLGKGNSTRGSWANGDLEHRAGGGVVLGRKLLQGYEGVHCQLDAVLVEKDVREAVTRLANHFGDGLDWRYNFGIYYGSTVAYACNYGGPQHTTGAQVWEDQAAVASKCTDDNRGWYGGWYSHAGWASSFGVTVNGNGWGYC